MVMLSMRPADVPTLHINHYPPSYEKWYDPRFSWYCTGYAKSQIDEPLPFFSMEKDPKRAIELLTWIQKTMSKLLILCQN